MFMTTDELDFRQELTWESESVLREWLCCFLFSSVIVARERRQESTDPRWHGDRWCIVRSPVQLGMQWITGSSSGLPVLHISFSLSPSLYQHPDHWYELTLSCSWALLQVYNSVSRLEILHLCSDLYDLSSDASGHQLKRPFIIVKWIGDVSSGEWSKQLGKWINTEWLHRSKRAEEIVTATLVKINFKKEQYFSPWYGS